MGVDHRRNISNLERIESKISPSQRTSHKEVQRPKWNSVPAQILEPEGENPTKQTDLNLLDSEKWVLLYWISLIKKEVKEAKSVLTVRGCWCIFSEFEFGKGRLRR